MRITLTLNDEFDPNAGGMGVTSALIAAYRDRGHDARCLSFADFPSGLPFRAKAFLFPELVAARLWRSRADVVDAAFGDGWLLSRCLRARRSARPLIVARSHGLIHMADVARREESARGGLELSWKYPLYWGGLRIWEATKSLRLADLCLFLNNQERDYAVEQLRLPEEKVRVVDNGIPEFLLGREVEELAPPTEGLRVAHIGSYLELKGVRYVAEALGALMARHPQLRATFLGTNCSPEQVLADYREDLHTRIEVIPTYRREELPDLLRGHSVVLSATLKEGFPLGTLEAMACGLAAITAATPGPLQYVEDGVNGLVVHAADASAIEAAIERLVDAPDLLARLRNGACATAQRYTWDRIADDTLALYGEAIERLHRGP